MTCKTKIWNRNYDTKYRLLNKWCKKCLDYYIKQKLIYFLDWLLERSSLQGSFSCFLCRFCSTGVYCNYTSSFLLRHSYSYVIKHPVASQLLKSSKLPWKSSVSTLEVQYILPHSPERYYFKVHIRNILQWN